MAQEGSSLVGVPYLLGSVHTFSPGYGYGARVPTVRNRPTLPAAVPKYRHAPLTDRANKMFTSTRLDVAGDRAVQRHKDQMSLQTSGEYGRFMFSSSRSSNYPESTSTAGSRPATSACESRSNSRQAATPSSSSSLGLGNTEMRSGGGTSHSSSGRLFSPINTSGVMSDSATINRYRKKDPLTDCFSRYTKYDLLAAKTPPKHMSGNTASHTALGNTTAAEFSRSWQRGLRPYKRPSTSGEGD